jgi:hypothetical protein
MVVRIKSLLVVGPLLVPLNSGGTVRLSPGQESGDLAEMEIADNTKVDKLLQRRAIEIVTVQESSGQAPDQASDATPDEVGPPPRPRKRAAAE